jgi:sulfonate transport system permease protein
MSMRLALPGSDKLIQWLLPAAIVLIWQAASMLIATRFLPAPTDVVAAAWRLLASGELFRSIWVSTWRALAGFAIGGAIGFAFGLANGLSYRCEQVFDSTLQMVRNIRISR